MTRFTNKKFFIGLILLLTSACNLPASTQQVDSGPTQTPPPPPTIAPPTQTLPPAATATLTLTPSPAPPPLYYTEEFNSPASYWQFFQTGGTGSLTSLIEDGVLQVNLPTEDDWGMAANDTNSYLNVFVRAKVTANPSGSAGLICRYTEADGWFEFDANSDGTYSLLLGQWLAPDVAKYIPVINDVSNSLSSGLNVELGMFCQDNYVQLFVNDVMIRRVEVTNYGLEEGGVGITFASLKEAPASVIFEWVKISSE